MEKEDEIIDVVSRALKNLNDALGLAYEQGIWVSVSNNWKERSFSDIPAKVTCNVIKQL